MLNVIIHSTWAFEKSRIERAVDFKYLVFDHYSNRIPSRRWWQKTNIILPSSNYYKSLANCYYPMDLFGLSVL